MAACGVSPSEAQQRVVQLARQRPVQELVGEQDRKSRRGGGCRCVRNRARELERVRTLRADRLPGVAKADERRGFLGERALCRAARRKAR